MKMKKLFILALGALMATSATAETLEERVEALEFQGYENYTKVTGRLEYRFDSYSREINDSYSLFNVDTSSAEARSEGKSGVGYQRVFLNLNVESKPSDKLSFYGKLSMAKFVNHFNNDGGTAPEDSSFNDLSRGSAASSSDIFVERAFANYSVTKDLTFTFGRLPTSHGAPRHFSSNEARRGNYPILSFGGNWDGMALSYDVAKGQSVKLVYTPIQSIPFKTSATDGVNNSKGDAVDTTVPAYALLYEFERDQFAGARNFYFIASYFSMDDMPTLPGAGSDLTLTLRRTSFYTELSGIANSKFDLGFHAVSTETKSEGGITGIGGWLTDSTDSDTTTGVAYGVQTRYSVKPNIKIGLEYFHGGEDAFLYDSANQHVASVYTTYGDAYHGFYSHDLDGGLKVIVGYIHRQVDNTRKVFNLIGETLETDNVETNTYAKFIAKF
jgi:hypothetical protein